MTEQIAKKNLIYNEMSLHLKKKSENPSGKGTRHIWMETDKCCYLETKTKTTNKWQKSALSQ